MGGSSKKVTVGYKYYLGWHMALCHGVIDGITRIRVDKRVAWEGSIVEGNIYINNPNLFGGESREGGIQGTVSILPGSLTQTQNSYLLSRLGSPLPAFRGVCSLIANQIYIGVNPYLKKWAITTKRIMKKSDGSEQWFPALAQVGTGDTLGNIAIQFVINRTGSMNDELPETKIFAKALLDYLWTLKTSNPAANFRLDINLVSYGGSATNTIYRNVTEADIATMKSVIDAYSAGGSASDSSAITGIDDLFDGALAGSKKVFIMMADTAIVSGGLLTTANYLTDNFTDLIKFYYKAGGGSVSGGTQIDNTGTILPIPNDGDATDAKAEILTYVTDGGDMNPAHILRECITDTTWGLGYPETDVDDASFEACAITLAGEDFGISILWDNQSTIEEFIKLILSHIEGSLYISRSTGKWVMSLARNDYDIDTILSLDESNVSSISGFKRKSISELANQVTVIFADSSTGEKNSVTVQNIALIQQLGATISETFEFIGITNAELASKVASRELRTLSNPLIACTLYTTRIASELNVGDVFKLSWARYGLSNIVMRVANIELGNISDNKIKIDCIQDTFGVQEIIYAPPSDTEWENPASPPQDLTYPLIYETPYYELAQQLGDDDAQAVAEGSGYVSLSGVAPSEDAYNMAVYNNIGGEYEEAGTADFSPTGTLVLTLLINELTFELENTDGIDNVVIGSYAVIGDDENSEFVRVDLITPTVDGYEITVGRGCLDTVRKQHDAGTRVYFSDYFVGSDNVEYVDGETPQFKLLPITQLGQLDVGLASVISTTMNSRKDRPYPPAGVEVNGLSYPATIPAGDDWVITWTERNRLQQTAGTIVDDLEATITPEVGTEYSCEIYDESNVLIASDTGLTGTTNTFTAVELATNYGSLTIKLWSNRDGYESWQTHEFQVTRLTP